MYERINDQLYCVRDGEKFLIVPTSDDDKLAIELAIDTLGVVHNVANDFLKFSRAVHSNQKLQVLDQLYSAQLSAIADCIKAWNNGRIKTTLNAYTNTSVQRACWDAVEEIRGDLKTEQYAQTENGVTIEYEDVKEYNPAAIVELADEHGLNLGEVFSSPDVATVPLESKNQRRKLKYEDLQLHDLHYNFGILELIDGRMIESPSTQKQTAANERKPVTSVQRILDYVERATDDERQLLLLEAWGGPDEMEF